MKRSKKIVTIHDLPYHLSHSTFGDSIKAWRQCDEMSIRAMARRLGMSAASLDDIERGRRLPSPERAAKIAKRLGHPIETWVELALQDQLEKGKLKLKVSVRAA